ncbi:MAG: type III restriction enzyme [Parcubacteria group bacterium Greene1014_20]|nr:MAG: type III restriction enzyme [Parcubacteria group bacterium Greene1014_20]
MLNAYLQLDAIKAIVGIFDAGKNIFQEEKSFGLSASGAIIGNELDIDEALILKNIRAIQKENQIDPVSETLGTLDFSIEMETATGKTYVYLRTILELNQKYGLKKFIILVPSVAIREGVLKTIEQTKFHFREIYNVGFGAFAYDSSKLSKVREFTQSLDIQIMIMTIQSFNSDDRVMRQTPDRFSGDSPLELIASIRPVIIMDEPQNMESELSKSAISDLRPLFKIRYSATHKELHNLMYRLTPADAYRRGLVKKIQVFGVKEYNPGAFAFKVNSIEIEKGMFPKAKVLIEIKNAAKEFETKEMVLKAGDDLFRKTKNEKYTGLIVNDVNAQFGRVELSNGNYYKLEAETENKAVIFRTQIRETIKAHFDKQESLGDSIKVLSLFFIDKVDNYVYSDSLIRNIFIEEFNYLRKNYPRFSHVNVSSVHRGYFASKKSKGETIYQDTRGDSKLDKDAYDLIMKDKERLLSFAEPVSFIFSHSALKEGWDNPNIFQICTLRDSQSIMKKRQEIGRGLRLPVDVEGNRIFDSNINVLTVVANESYEEYVSKLQDEFRESGYDDVPEADNAKEKKIKVKLNSKQLESDDFKELWRRISQKTEFQIQIDSSELIRQSVEEINKLDVSSISARVGRGNVFFDEKNQVQAVFAGQSIGEKLEKYVVVGNIVARIARETELTKKTILNILNRVENLSLYFENPEECIRSVVGIIRNIFQNLSMGTGLQYTPTGETWSVSVFDEFESFSSKVLSAKKGVYDHTAFDSHGELNFIRSLENSSSIKVYAKLPRNFKVSTPWGEYIPDWAIVWNPNPNSVGQERLYLVRETKFGYRNLDRQLSDIEKQKIKCAEKHFEAIGFDDFAVAEKENLSDLLKK